MRAKLARVTFQPIGTRVDVGVGSTILEAGREAGLILAANCGGNGLCGRCRVTVLGDNVPEPTGAEIHALSQEEIRVGQRLACRARVRGDAGVHLPPATLGNQQRLQLEGNAQVIRIDRGAEVIGCTAAGKRPLGVAVDIGCTKIAAYLLDLESGDQLAACGIANPQISYGEDLISRLVFARRGKQQAQQLARCVQAAISELINTLTKHAKVDPDQVADLCVVGNTAMTHLFLELPVEGLLAAPFVAATTSAVDKRARDVGIEVPNDVCVHVLPGIGSFVGADHVAMILANGLHNCSHVALGIDIGTNTEIVLSRPDQSLLLTASCPAGPTFEGGHIRHGMRAAPGALERIKLRPDGLALKTIGDQPPVGICGSGVIDAVAYAIALLLQTGAIDYRGHLQAGEAGVRRGASGNEYLLVAGKDTGHGKDIVITQQDISEIQLAKAAVAASIRTLLKVSNTRDEEVGELVLAGAFGSYLDLDSSIAIGLLPGLPNATFLQAGNAAGTGAKMALVSGRMRDRACQIARRAVRIDLKQQKNFNRELAHATRFPTEKVKQA